MLENRQKYTYLAYKTVANKNRPDRMDRNTPGSVEVLLIVLFHNFEDFIIVIICGYFFPAYE